MEISKKEMYMRAREEGHTNAQIAQLYNVQEKTVDRAIGKNKNEESNKMNYERFDDTFDEDDTNGEILENVSGDTEESNRGIVNPVIYPITLSCCDCGDGFVVSPAKQKFFNEQGWELPKRCPMCAKKKKEEMLHIVCCDCGIKFSIGNNEKKYFEENNLEIPKRCKQCRDFKRERNEGKNLY